MAERERGQQPHISIAFPMGCEVRVSGAGRNATTLRRQRTRHGWVCGYSRDWSAVLVRWDRLLNTQPWPRDYVERV